MNITRQQYRALAELGGRAELGKALTAINTIVRAVPSLRDEARTSLLSVLGVTAAANGKASPKRRRMTKAQRKAVSERMRKYWAARRKAR